MLAAKSRLFNVPTDWWNFISFHPFLFSKVFTLDMFLLMTCDTFLLMTRVASHETASRGLSRLFIIQPSCLIIPDPADTELQNMAAVKPRSERKMFTAYFRA